MTSANRTDDPIITKEEELEQLDAVFGAFCPRRHGIQRDRDAVRRFSMRVTAGHVQMLR